jgi:hypothetical protein
MERDNNEMNGREKNSGFETIRINRGRAEPVISERMGPRLIASPDVFFASTEHTRNATIHYTHFNEKLVPNGYDMPPNDKLNAYDAATINFAMLGAQSHIQNFFQKELGGYGSTSAALESTNGHNMMTGLFGNPRRDLDLERCLGEAMRLGKEAIDAFFERLAVPQKDIHAASPIKLNGKKVGVLMALLRWASYTKQAPRWLFFCLRSCLSIS